MRFSHQYPQKDTTENAVGGGITPVVQLPPMMPAQRRGATKERKMEWMFKWLLGAHLRDSLTWIPRLHISFLSRRLLYRKIQPRMSLSRKMPHPLRMSLLFPLQNRSKLRLQIQIPLRMRAGPGLVDQLDHLTASSATQPGHRRLQYYCL